jgi:apolipoprotein N-acyltransferase
VLLAASFPKFGLPSFAWVAVAPLFVAVSIRATAPLYTAWAAFRLGMMTGLVYFAGTLYWTVAVMSTYGGLPLAAAIPIAGLLVGYLALYVGAVAVLVGESVRRFGVAGVWLAPVFWVAAEWARGTIGSGFPWVPLGSSQITVLPIAQLASVTGVYGVSLLVALVSAAAAVVALSRKRHHLIGAALVLLLVMAVAGAGMMRLADGRLTSTGRVVRVGLVQGNVEQDMKWDPKYLEPILSRYLRLSREAILNGAQVVVWPEASTPFFLNRDSVYAEPIRTLAAQTKTPFVIGTDETNGTEIYNAASVIGADGKPRGSYRKIHLVPFGEYVPMKKLLFFVGPLVEAVSDFVPGTDFTVLDVGDGLRASVAICYESTYPTLTRAFVNGGAQLLLVITNDAWFGNSSAAYQHFQMGAMRAIETGRYLGRAANTGITAVVDPYGRTVARVDMFQPLTLTADVRLLDDRTIYTRIGDLVAWLCVALTAMVAVVLRRRA